MSRSSKHRDDDRPRPVSGEVEVNGPSLPPRRRQGSTASDPAADTRATHEQGITMPAGRIRYQSILSAPSAVLDGSVDVETVSSMLDAFAQVGRVRLRIMLPDGRVFFEAYPPRAHKGEERAVPIDLPQADNSVLRGAMPRQTLEQVAATIESALRQRSTSGVQRQALDAERKRLSLLFDFSEKVCQLAAFDEVVTRFLGDVTRLLEAREGTFFAMDKRSRELYIRCHHGSRSDVVRGFRLKIGEGIAGAVAEDGRPRLVNNVERCPDYVPKNNPIRNIIAAPVKVRDRLIGVINVSDRAHGQKPFSNRDLQLLVSLARMGGIALDNARLYEEIRQLSMSLIEALTNALDAKDTFALGHSRRVAHLACTIGDRLELEEQDRDMLRIAALLHDVGNLAISQDVLKKPAPLTDEERAMIKEHPALGASILSPVNQLSAVLPGIVDHHERYDGRGYPRRLKGDEISTQGRIIAIADSFDAMTHDRPFREACSAPEALAEITANSGTQFDPVLVPIFVECFRQLGLDRVSLDQLLPPTAPELDF